MSEPVVWPRRRLTADGRRLMITDPPMGIGLSVELQPRWVWMVMSMYRLATLDKVEFCKPITIEYSLN